MATGKLVTSNAKRGKKITGLVMKMKKQPDSRMEQTGISENKSLGKRPLSSNKKPNHSAKTVTFMVEETLNQWRTENKVADYAILFDQVPLYENSASMIYADFLPSPLGNLLAICDANGLLALEFVDGKENVAGVLQRFRKGLLIRQALTVSDKSTVIIKQKTNLITNLERELAEYFAGTLHIFKTPCMLDYNGTAHQIASWQALCQIPYGRTIGYADQAISMGLPSKHCRAVASANGRNPIVLLVPCHRVINSNGNLGGFAAGLDRKKWLIEHEARWNGE